MTFVGDVPSSSQLQSRRIIAVVRHLLLLAIVIYLIWHIVSHWSAVRSLVEQWSGLHLVGALITGLLAYQCLFFGWLFLLYRLGYFETRYLLSYSRIWWTSYFYRYSPGKVLLLVERARMGRTVGIPPGPGAALAIIETMFAILAAAWVSLLAISYYVVNKEWLIGIVGALSLTILVLLPHGYRLICNLEIIRNRFPELSSFVLHSMDMLTCVPFFVCHFLFLGLSFYLCARSIQVVDQSGFLGLCGIYALSHLIGLITMIAPAGLGVREGALSLQLKYILSSGAAEAVAVGGRIWFTLLELLSLTIVFLCSPSRPDYNNNQDR